MRKMYSTSAVATLASIAAACIAWSPAALLAQTPPPAQTPGRPEASLQLGEPHVFIHKSQMTTAERKISGGLRSLISMLASRGTDKTTVLASKPETLSNAFRRISTDGMIQCYVDYRRDAEAVSTAIAEAGGRVELLSREMSLLQCQLPYDAVTQLATNEQVREIRLPSYAMRRAGSVISEGDGVHRSNLARTDLGATGAGKKVGIISDGIMGIGISKASGDIPATYDALSARADNNLNAGAEGLAMMEIVYDLAPEASLAFSNPGTSAEMVEAINILDSTFHCNIICDDLGFADEPFFEDGPIATRINQAVANGAIYVSAGGNAADQAYHESDFSGMTKTIGGASRTVQDFGGGDWNIRCYVPAGGTIVAILQWNDPWNGSGNDYDLYLTDDTGVNVYTDSQMTQDGDGTPMEALGVINKGTAGGYAYLVISKSGGLNRHLKLTTWGEGYLTEHFTSTGSIWGHPAAESVLCCGAARWSEPGSIESFSSQGPVRIDFPSLLYRNKPDLCGIDGVSVTANGGFVTPFYGTSAAAPHVAAICAQAWSVNPSMSNSAIRAAVQNTATDMSPAGYDTVSGFGLADALNASWSVRPAPEIITSVDRINIPENNTAELQVRLSVRPTADTIVSVSRSAGDSDIIVQTGSLTFTQTNWNTNQTVTLAAAEDPDSLWDQATIQLSASGFPTKDLIATEEDNDKLEIATDASILTIPEGGTATFRVKLGAPPSSATVVSVSRLSGDADIDVSSGASLTFTLADWDTYQTVTLTSLEDSDACHGQTIIRCSTPTMPTKDVTAIEQDNDLPTIVMDRPALTIPEGGTATLQIKLSRPPCGNTLINVVRFSGDGDISVPSGAALLFTTSNWDTYQTTTLAGAEDQDAANGQATIRCLATGLTPVYLNAAEQDNDLPLITLDRNTITIPEGGTATFQVMLERQPDANVTVQIDRISGDNDITVASGQTLTFTPWTWSTCQSVTLAATTDLDAANGQTTIRCLAAGLPSKDVIATEQDTDTLAIVTNVTAVIVPEGGTAGFQVKLNVLPTADVTVNIGVLSGDGDVTTPAGASLLFTTANWDTYQTVLLTAAEDDDTANGQTLIRCTAEGLANKDITATEQDNDTLSIVADKTSISIPEGGTASFLVKLSARPVADIVVGTSWSSGDEDVTVQSGSTTTFTSTTWNTYQAVILAAAKDSDSSSGQAIIRCSSASLAHLDVTATEQDSTTPPPPPAADADKDGIADASDNCPASANPNQSDVDGDKAGDVCDKYPNDAQKTDPGDCGCGASETDTDRDGTQDCNDNCPEDANKTKPGVCGCGLSDVDLDGDGLSDCKDLCPNDPRKSLPNICGCGKPDIDSDADGLLDCLDGCPLDANKKLPGICGCGVRDLDADTDGVMDCEDNCPTMNNPSQQDSDGDGTGDTCQNQTEVTARTTPTEQITPATALCGAGAAQTLAVCAFGLTIIQITSRRRKGDHDI